LLSPPPADEVSLGPNKGGSNTGFVLLGAHWLPSNFELLKQVDFDVPTGAAHVLTTTITVTARFVVFDVSVNGVLALTFNDTSFVRTINGGHVGLRSFFTDINFTSLKILVNV
jgi:hypothetical protein